MFFKCISFSIINLIISQIFTVFFSNFLKKFKRTLSFSKKNLFPTIRNSSFREKFPMNHHHSYKVGSPLRINRFLSTSSPTHSKSPSPHVSSSRSKKKSLGRFIPTKVVSNDLYELFLRDFDEKATENISPKETISMRTETQTQTYSKLLKTNMSPSKSSKMLRFNSEDENRDNFNRSPHKYQFLEDEFPIPTANRKIPKLPYKQLDSPGLRDDFYLNLLDWSSENFLAIGLERKVYTWSAYNNKSQKILELENQEDYIGSIAWSQNGHQIALGNNFGEIRLFDLVKSKFLSHSLPHALRIGSLAWNGNLLASGSRDKKVVISDMRTGQAIFNINAHKQEICGLKWSFDENLLASGGNDNKVNVFSLRQQKDYARFCSHTAAVKALAWNPHRTNILATGGGTSDRTIRFWNLHDAREILCVDSGSQVCNLMFSKNSEELVSTHGYSLNQINVWKYPTMEKLTSLTGHSMRVLFLAGSPCGENIVTGAGDETLMFWNVFPPSEKRNINGLMGGRMDLR